VLVTRRLPSSVIGRLEPWCTVDLHAGEGAIQQDELHRRLAAAEGLICLLTDRVDRATLDAAPRLKIAANVAVGYDNIDVAAARERGIVVTYTPDVLTEAVAEFTWALLLSITRRVCEGDRVVRAGAWRGWALDFMLGSELRGKQLGIVGFGRIGQAVAARAPAFGMRVAYTSRTPKPSVDGAFMPLDRLLSTSDVVSLHCPLTPETTHLINQTTLARMKRSAYLISAARGPVVDEAGLVWALENRLIAGAALDVYEKEPEIHKGLLAFENVLLSPHLGSSAIETRTTMIQLAADNVIAVLTGRPPLTPVV
jgi:glyoxylate reductase